MKADFDDAPWRVRKKRNLAPMVIAMLAAASVTAGGLYMADSKTAVRETVYDSITNMGSGRTQEQVSTKVTAPFPGVSDKHWIREDNRQQAQRQIQPQQIYKQQPAAQPERQTSFSDANYVPKGATNVAPAQRQQKRPSEIYWTEPKPKKQEIVAVGKADRKFSDYCGWKEGSIKQRNCRTRWNLLERNNSYNGR